MSFRIFADGSAPERKVKGSSLILLQLVNESERIEKNTLTEEEKDAFDAPVPSQIKRFMTKFIDSLQKGNLNRKRK